MRRKLARMLDIVMMAMIGLIFGGAPHPVTANAAAWIGGIAGALSSFVYLRPAVRAFLVSRYMRRMTVLGLLLQFSLSCAALLYLRSHLPDALDAPAIQWHYGFVLVSIGFAGTALAQARYLFRPTMSSETAVCTDPVA